MLSVQFSAAVALRRDSNFKPSPYHGTGLLQLQDSEDFQVLDLSPEKIYEVHSSDYMLSETEGFGCQVSGVRERRC
jgi:hypothetical protein